MSRSMTPAVSPIASSDASPESKQWLGSVQLTPNSKIKAMLAAVDDDSDLGASDRSNGHGPQSASRNNSTDVRGRRSPSLESSRSSSGDDSSRPPVPRGKVAARLRNNVALDTNNSQSDGDDVGNAYNRQKRRLVGRSADTRSRDGNSPRQHEALLSTNEDDILPNVSRRNKTSPRLSPLGSRSSTALAETSPRSSPSLFLTPQKEQRSLPPSPSMDTSKQNGSDSDLPVDPQANQRFLALVARKRAEREEKARLEAERRARKLAEQSKDSNVDMSGNSDDSDVAGGQKLTEQARPTRKASKKALEEMNRETQRMSRNMQLAHQARTKRKITKESLFARFNFRSGTPVQPAAPAANSSSVAASSNPASDAEARINTESPPTSPVTPSEEMMKDPEPNDSLPKLVDAHEGAQIRTLDEESPDVQTVFTHSLEHKRDNEARAMEDQSGHGAPYPQGNPTKGKMPVKRRFDFRLPNHASRQSLGGESESDLEVLPVSKPKRKLDVFDRLPAAKASEGRTLQKLRALAHLTSPDKRAVNSKSNMSLTEMQNSLQKRARQQAARERAEKIQDLKDRGIIIQTAEERQKDQAEVEDLLEKARKEAEELQQKEKTQAKKQAKENGETLADDSSELDGEYEDNDADQSELDLSGSDEEEDGESEDGQSESDGDHVEQENSEEAVKVGHDNLIQDEASEASEEDENDEVTNEEAESSNTEEEQRIHAPSRRRERKVIDDDEDEQEDEDMDMAGSSEKVPSALLISTNNQSIPDLGLPALNGLPMGMTQAFAATMADSTQADTQQGVTDQEEDSLAFVGAPPEPEFPVYDMDDSLEIIPDSQEASHSNPTLQNEIRLDFSQSEIQETLIAESIGEPTLTQVSEIPDPSQDVGFVLTSPVAERYASFPPSTVETVILPRTDAAETPVAKKKGRLMKKADVTVVDESGPSVNAEQAQQGTIISADAFDVLKRGSKRSSNVAAKFDKKKSNAQEMVEEQAQESEDEYAGLGGASDDESGGEEDEEVKKMIEQGEVDVDERELAAFYADKERASDEKAVEKLFKDINNGMLRRKRGAEFDLSDSEDDAEARRRRKRKEFAKMRKALLENENVGKIAEDPKKLAFLQAIEDREDDDDLGFLEQAEESSQSMIDINSQDVPDSQPNPDTAKPDTALGKRKRPLTEAAPDATNRPPAAARRAPATKKPSSLAEIRASVSFLIEEPDAVPLAPPSSSPVTSDNEGDENNDADLQTSTINVNNYDNSNNSNKSTNNPFTTHPNRRRTTTNPVIDRLSLKRTSSTSTNSNINNLFFNAPSSSTLNNGGFKPPSLLRRATTSSFSLGNNKANEHGISHLAETERAAGGGEKGDFVRRGGTKRSSVNWRVKEGRGGEEGRDRAEGERLRRMLGRGGSLGGLGVGNWE